MCSENCAGSWSKWNYALCVQLNGKTDEQNDFKSNTKPNSTMA